MEVVRSKTTLSSSSTCSREEQCGGGRRVSQNERQQRLEDRFDCHSALNQGVSNRSFCVSPDTSTGQTRQLAARYGCDPRGCVHNQLEKFDSVRISTIQPISSRPSQDKEGNGNINIHCPVLSAEPWWLLLIDLVIDYPVYLGNNPNLLADVSHLKTIHPLFSALRLAV